MRKVPVWLWMWVCVPVLYAAQSNFDPDQNTWTLNNGWVNAVFQLTVDGHFVAQELDDLRSGDRWTAAINQPSALIRWQAGSEVFDAQRQYMLMGQSVQTLPTGVRQTIVLQDLKGTAQFTVVLNAYDDQPVIRYSIIYRNVTGSNVTVTAVNLLP